MSMSAIIHLAYARKLLYLYTKKEPYCIDGGGGGRWRKEEEKKLKHTTEYIKITHHFPRVRAYVYVFI